MGPTGNTRVVQIHPTRQCNLRCLHCYSSSSPDERDMLDLALLGRAVSDAADEGYGTVTLSGGEPLLYRPLGELLRHAHGLGLTTAVATNGMLLDRRRLEMLRGAADLIAISVDGVPESHNRMRGSERAFAKMHSRLAGLRESGIPFGFIFTLTQHNLNELEWVTEFAVSEGAKLLQIHPLEEVGQATGNLEGKAPDETEMGFACWIADHIEKQVGDRLRVQVDVVNKEALIRRPDMVYAMPEAPGRELPLAEIISPLIIEADATVVPLEYGFPREYALGNLRDASLKTLADGWRSRQLTAFHRLCREVHREATAESMPQFLNWFDLMMRHVRRPAAARSIEVAAPA